MGTISSAFSIISQALDADQAALGVVANNVANANTPGYTREVPNWQEGQPIEINGIRYGTGVTETGATSVRDRVLEARFTQQQQSASASAARLDALDMLQSLFTPASGSSASTAGNLGSDITKFFDSFSNLEANAGDNPLRQQVLSAANTLAGDLSGVAASLNAQKSALDQKTAAIATQVNALTSAIGQLNQQIESTSPEGDAGTLEDERQQDLNQLSQLIGINQIRNDNNGLSITSTSGQMVVADGTSYPLTTGSVASATHFYLGTTDVTSELSSGSGELGGDLEARDQDIPAVLSALDQLAYSISTKVNALNNAGTDLDGVTGTEASPLYIFNEPAEVAGSAINMSVVMTNPNQIAAAAAGQGEGGNSNAAAMANLAKQNIAEGMTPSNFYSNLITTLGATVSGVKLENTAQEASLSQLRTQISALSSVNLNDEAASMQQFERSYQAASQVFTILDSVMAAALNLGDATAVA